MTTILSRRGFLRIGGCAAIQLGLGTILGTRQRETAYAQNAAEYQALVCIFLFGGNDANNTLVPLDGRYARYRTLRGELALADTALLPIAAADGTAFGLHPSLGEIQRLYNDGTAAFVVNVGTLVQPTSREQYRTNAVPLPTELFSHSDQQVQWQSAIPNTAESASGWGGGIVDALGRAGVAFGSLPGAISVAGDSLFLTGWNSRPTAVIPGAPLGLAGSAGIAGTARAAAFQSLLHFDAGFYLVQAANDIAASGVDVAAVLNKAFAGAGSLGVTFPGTTLGAQLQQIAQIIQVRSQLHATRQIFFCSLGGFDTHSNQLATQAGLLQQLSQAIDAFYAATVTLGVERNVTAFTASDFNRTLQPNGTNGSDHAWGSHHVVIGAGVNGGNLYGTFPELALNTGDDATNRGVWIPTISTDRYGATLAGWFGVLQSDIDGIFANLGNFPAERNLGFMS